MMRFSIALFLASLGFAAPGQLNSGQGTATFPASVPYTSIQDTRIDLRFTVTAASLGNTVIFDFNGAFGVLTGRVSSSGGTATLLINSGDGGTCQFGLSFPTNQDTVARVRRIYQSQVTLETWTAQGGNYQEATGGCSSGGGSWTQDFSGPYQIGNSTSWGSLVFAKWYSGTIALGAVPPNTLTTGTLYDYEFNSNGNDSSGRGNNLTMSSPVYGTAPTYAPACRIAPLGSPYIFTGRIGQLFPLDASQSFPLNGGNTLVYSASVLTSGTIAASGSQPGSPSGTISVQFTPAGYTLGSSGTVSPTLSASLATAPQSFVIQETVTDSSSQSTSCGIKVGMVPASPSGPVIISNNVHSKILGIVTPAFADPRIAYETQGNAFSDLMIQKLAGTSPYAPDFPAPWNTALTGTITVYGGSVTSSGTSVTWSSGTQFTGLSAANGDSIYVNGTQCVITGAVTATAITCASSVGTNASPVWYGSNTIVGSGTTFKATFGGGTTTPVSSGTKICVWYPISNSPYPGGVSGRRHGVVVSILDDTHLMANFSTLTGGTWVSDTYLGGLVGASSGLSYAYMEESQNTGTYGTGGWGAGGSAFPGNYYDNVMALYARWYATGIDDYLVAAQLLADRWWSYPVGDKGLAYETALGSPWANYNWAIRQRALAGVWMRNADNPPFDYTPGLRLILNYPINIFAANSCSRLGPAPSGSWPNQYNTFGGSSAICQFDIRETGYWLAEDAYEALFDTDPTSVATAKDQLSKAMTNVITPQVQTNGSVTEVEPNASSNASGQTVSLTVGSPYVTNGSVWNLAWFNNAGSYNFANPPATTVAYPGGTSQVYPPYHNSACPSSNCAGTAFDANWYYLLVPQIAVTSISAANPLVVNFSSSPSWLSTSHQVQLSGITGCAVAAGTAYTVSATTSTSATISINGTGCTASGSAAVFDAFRAQLSDANGSAVNYAADTSCASSTCTGIGWQIGGFLGPGVQPYQIGVFARGMYFTSLALTGYDNPSVASAKSIISGFVGWMSSIGLNPTSKGLLYGTGFINCTPPTGYAGCVSAGDRSLNGEAMNVPITAYLSGQATNASRSLGSLMMSAMFSITGDSSQPPYDGTNIITPNMAAVPPGGPATSQFMYTSISQHKWLGYYWGVSAPFSWQATLFSQAGSISNGIISSGTIASLNLTLPWKHGRSKK